jgi:hypothetical protein
MKPWFVLFVLWALSGIVTLRQAYAEDAPANRMRQPVAQSEETNFLF